MGEGYQEGPVDDSTDDDPVDQALDEQCPDAKDLSGPDDPSDLEAARSFEDADGHSIDVQLSTGADELTGG